MMEQNQDMTYRKIALLVDQWLEFHKGETFDLDTICRQLEIKERQNRHYVVQKLSNEVKKESLEKSNKIYRSIDNTLVHIDWSKQETVPEMDLTWPHSHEEDPGLDTRFGFDGHVSISPGNLILIAGVTNTGKTTFCQNFLLDNMDQYPCTLFANEYTGGEFRERISRMTWVNPLKADGTPKFELIERHENHKDIIRPDNINIIDWLLIPDNFYLIGSILDGIKKKLKKGIAVIAIQKDPNKLMGVGGMFGEHLVSVALSMDFGRLTVRKCKKWDGYNPNFKTYGSDIINKGTEFHDIRELKKCPHCSGFGKSRGQECEECTGKGWVDVYH